MATKKYVSLEKLGLYDEKIKKVISDGDAASLESAKSYADGLAVNYDAAGSAATAEANAKAYADGKDAAIQAAQKAGDDAAAAAAAADGKAVAAQGDVDALETYVGTFTHDTAKTVVEYINAKTDGIATSGNLEALGARVTAVEGDVATIKGDYLKGTDKTELEGKITAAETAVATEKSRAEGVESGLRTDVDTIKGDYLKAEDKTELSDAIAAEKERAEGVEGGLGTRIKAIEDDYLKAADKEALQTQINTIMNNPDAEGAINSINEFTQYVEEHGTIADGFRTDIDKNKEDIAAEVERAGTAEAALSGRLDTLEAIDHDAYVGADTALKTELEGKINAKADASTVSDMDAAYKAADLELSGKITALEGKFAEGEGSVSDMISDAIDAERTEIDAELAKKVDKVDGKGLSTNDLTNELKANYDAAYEHSQVAHAPANAQANVIESIKVNGSALTITDKAVDIAVPTDNAQLTNGAGYLVANDIANKADKATTLAGYGITDAYTSAQTDTAIANAVGQFVECSEEDINNLFTA